MSEPLGAGNAQTLQTDPPGIHQRPAACWSTRYTCVGRADNVMGKLVCDFMVKYSSQLPLLPFIKKALLRAAKNMTWRVEPDWLICGRKTLLFSPQHFDACRQCVRVSDKRKTARQLLPPPLSRTRCVYKKWQSILMAVAAKTCTLRVISLCFIATLVLPATGIGLMVNKNKTSADDELLSEKQFRTTSKALS